MFDLWQRVFNSAHLGKDSGEDRNRLGMLTKAKATEMTDSVAEIGHIIAKSHAASHLTPVKRLSEVYDGITQVCLSPKDYSAALFCYVFTFRKYFVSVCDSLPL